MKLKIEYCNQCGKKLFDGKTICNECNDRINMNTTFANYLLNVINNLKWVKNNSSPQSNIQECTSIDEVLNKCGQPRGYQYLTESELIILNDQRRRFKRAFG